jgi:hypothetical protein
VGSASQSSVDDPIPARAGLRSWAWIGAAALPALAAVSFAPADNVSAVAVVGSVCAAALFVALRRARVPLPAVLANILALTLYVTYLGYTTFLERAYDSMPHIVYLDHIARGEGVPESAYCSVCHHPPLYYWIAGTLRGWDDGYTTYTVGVQLLSLGFATVFVAFSTLAIHRIVRTPWRTTLATALVAFWPYSVINSVRVGNDPLTYALVAIAFYGLVRWTLSRHVAWMALSVVATVAGYLTKANVVLFGGALVVATAACLLRDPARRAWKGSAAALLVLVIALGSVSALRGNEGDNVGRRVLGRAYKTEGSDLTVRPASYYLWLDPVDYLARPFVVNVNFQSTEPTFWNHFAKSSLFGTQNSMPAEESDFAASPRKAQFLSGLLLSLTAMLVGGAVAARRRLTDIRIVSWIVVLTFVAGALGFHVLFPAGHHADFRFVFPIVIPLAALLVDGFGVIGSRWRWNWVSWIGIGLTVVFVSLSVSYFVPGSMLDRREDKFKPVKPAPPSTTTSGVDSRQPTEAKPQPPARPPSRRLLLRPRTGD